MAGTIRTLLAAALCAAVLAGAPATAAAQPELERIEDLLRRVQRITSEAGVRLQALTGARDGALRARDHLAAARSQVQASVGTGNPADRLQSAIAARRALDSSRQSAATSGQMLPEELIQEIRRADGALESVEAALRRNQPTARQKAAAGTADRHLGTVDYLLSTIVEARQTRLVATIEAYQLFVTEARQSLNGLDQATRNAAP